MMKNKKSPTQQGRYCLSGNAYLAGFPDGFAAGFVSGLPTGFTPGFFSAGLAWGLVLAMIGSIDMAE